MKSTLRGFPFTILFLVLASFTLIALGIGIFGALMLIGVLQEPMTAAQQQSATSTAQTLTWQATSTAEAISAISATEQARWSRVYYDPFDSSVESAWPLGDLSDSTATVNISIEDGGFYIDASSIEDVFQPIWSNIEVDSDFMIEVDVQKASGEVSGAYGLIFGKNQYNFYTFLIDETPQFWVSVVRHGEWYLLIEPFRTSAINPGNVNTLKVVSEANQMKFYINDKQVGHADWHSLERAGAGLCFELLEDQNAVIIFDNFSLFTLVE